MSNVYQKRIEAVRKGFDAAGIDALLLTGIYNISYITGTKGDDLNVLITRDDAFVITDFRYREMAQGLTWLTYFETSAKRLFTELISGASFTVLGVEEDNISLGRFLKVKEAAGTRKVVPVKGIVESLRTIKDEDEQQRIAAAEKLGDEAFSHMLGFIKAGLTESEVAAELEHYMRSHGASGLSFSTIAVSGPNSSYPHGVPGLRKLQAGDFLTLDFGCVLNGYCSDMTRTVAIGQPSDEMKKVYDIVLRAQLNACANIHAGLTGIQCDAFARDVIAEAGYGEFFGHSLGHGLGLQVHEDPRFSAVYDKTIAPDTVVSIEPGIYLPGKFGVRIEDLAIIKPDGIINLASSPKELIIL